MRKYNIGKKELLLLLCSSLIFLFASDQTLKFIAPSAYGATRYGWTIPENTVYQEVVENSPGEPRKIIVNYFENGFKRWGDIHTEKIKMFIVGDSVTQMNWVSNGEEWYSFLEKEFENLELFVYGGGGYGSLQELMVLDDFIDKIQPHLILLQFHGNDFANNLYALDLKDYPYNNHAVRPYLENDKIVYRLPLPLPKLRRCSFIADRILKIYDMIMWNMAVKDLSAYKQRRELSRKNRSDQEKKTIKRLGKEAFAVTNRIMAMIKKRAVHTPVYFLNIDGSRGEKLCKANNFIDMPGIREHLLLKEREGHRVRMANNCHWNKLGNELVGQQLVEYFKKKNIL